MENCKNCEDKDIKIGILEEENNKLRDALSEVESLVSDAERVISKAL